MNSIWGFLQDQSSNNPFFTGGSVLMITGALLAICREVPGRIFGWLKRRCFVVIDIPDREPAFEWIDKWLANHPYSRTRARSLTVKILAVDYRERRNESSGTSGSGLDSPGPDRPPGPHWSCESKPAFSNLPKLLSPGRSAEGDAFRGEPA